MHARNLDRRLRRRVFGQLLVRAQVDDCPDAVIDERLPAFFCQLADAVGANDRVESSLAAVLGRVPAEVADVEAAVPGEVATTLQPRPTQCL